MRGGALIGMATAWPQQHRQPHAQVAHRGRLVQPHEGLEHAAAQLGRDACAAVGDGQPVGAAACRCLGAGQRGCQLRQDVHRGARRLDAHVALDRPRREGRGGGQVQPQPITSGAIGSSENTGRVASWTITLCQRRNCAVIVTVAAIASHSAISSFQNKPPGVRIAGLLSPAATASPAQAGHALDPGLAVGPLAQLLADAAQLQVDAPVIRRQRPAEGLLRDLVAGLTGNSGLPTSTVLDADDSAHRCRAPAA